MPVAQPDGMPLLESPPERATVDVPTAVFTRPIPPRVLLAIVLGFGVSGALPAVAVPAGVLAASIASSLPSPTSSLADFVGRALCVTAPVVAFTVVVLYLVARHSRVRIWPDVIAFNLPFAPWAWARHVIPITDITRRETVSSGVRVHSGRLGNPERAYSFIVPADDEATAQRVHELLDAPALHGDVGSTAGRDVPALVYAAAIAALTVWSVGAFVASEIATPALGAGLAVATIVAAVRALLAACRVWGLLHVGGTTLSLRHHVVPWADVAAVAVADGRVAVETRDGRRLRLHVGRAAEDELARALARRLALAGQPPPARALPCWASRRRRRVEALVTLALLALPSAPLVWLFQRREVYTRTDHTGQTLHVVYRRWDGRPDIVVLVADGARPAGPAAVSSADCAAIGTAGLRARWLWPVSVAPGTPSASVVDLRAGEVRFADGSRVALPDGATVAAVRPGQPPLASSEPFQEGSSHLQALGFLDGPSLDSEAYATATATRAMMTILHLVARVLDAQDGSLDDRLARRVERLFPGSTDCALAAIADGVASRRCLVVTGRDALLAVAIDFGVVTSVLVAPLAPPGAGCAACVAARDHPGGAMRRLASGQVLAARLPGREEVVAAVEAVRKGATVEAALGPIAPALWGR